MFSHRYSVMLVDDESIFIDDLAEEIQEANLRFRVTEQCVSSSQALKLYKENPCDVVFTDIQMPEMDGLQMTVEMKKINPQVVVVFLTGYGKIEYAQRAIRCGGFDFLLKPLKKDELIHLLTQIETYCDHMFAERIGERLSSILLGGKVGEAFSEAVSLSFAAVNVGAFLPRYRQPEGSKEIDRKIQSVFQEISRDFGDQNDRFVWISKSNALDGMIIATDGAMPKIDRAALFEKIGETAAPYPVTYAAVDGEYACSEWADAMETIKALLSQHKLFAKSSMIDSGSSADTDDGKRFRFPYDVFYKALQKRDYELLRHIWAGIPTNDIQYPLKAVEMENVLVHLSEIADRFIEEPEEQKRCRAQMFRAAYCAENVESCMNELFDIIITSSKVLNEDDSNRMLAKRIEDYLKKNLSNDITIDDIANAFSYNASYIHRVFKKEYRRPPMKYLNEIRIAQAIQMMDSDPLMRIRDIAWSVGFTDQYYFSRVFKRLIGMTPGEYQANRNKPKNNRE